MAAGFPVKANYATGDILTATNLNDLAGTVNLTANATPTTATQMAGKNAIINGAFNVWQRGTSFTPASGSYVYTADRFGVSRDGTGATVTVSQQAFTAGTAPVTGYEGQYFFRYAQTVAGTGGTYLTVCSQKVENVRTWANQAVTYSFWAKADTTRTVTVGYGQIFGSGGSADVYGNLGSTITLTTSWVRYTVTGTIPSVSGKTIGANSFLEVYIGGTTNSVQTIDIWGVQLEAGSSATPFQTATGTLQGELAACQRYLPAFTGPTSAFNGYAYQTNGSLYNIPFPVTARVAPTGITVSGTTNAYALNTATSVTPAFSVSSINNCQITASHTIIAGQGAQLVVGGLLLFTGCEF
jgi:hypothetical protein